MRTRTTKEVRVLYPATATRCVRRLRVVPPARRGGQSVLSLQWRCTPEPDAIEETEDEFGNRVLELRHHKIAREFCFAMRLETERDGSSPADRENLPPTGIGAYLLPSALCESSEVIRHLAARLRQHTDSSPATLCHVAFAALEYSPQATDAATSATQALLRGAGVCQDYTHLMIALCRASGLPARYISGYSPAEGRMHAWVEVFFNGVWQAWDPTHDRPTHAECVFVACGRDFRDVAPHAGRYQGVPGARLWSHCRTKVLDLEVPQ